MIITVTLNPAMDRLMFVNGFTFNVTNRIYRREDCVGGKGTHVSVNLACLGEKNIATGIAMGPTGRQIIENLEANGVACDFVCSDDGDSRTNYILVDGKTSTLICEKGPDVSIETLEAFSKRYDALTDQADYVIISGDASNFLFGAGMSLQDRLIEVAHAKGAHVVLDSAGESLAAGVRLRPFMIKPNLEELTELTGIQAATDEEIADVIRSLSGYGIEIIAVSMGSRGSIVKYGNSIYRVGIAKVEAVNTVGCGDAYLSGFVYAMKNGYSAEHAISFAVACGGAEAVNPLSVGLDKNMVLELCKNIEIRIMEN